MSTNHIHPAPTPDQLQALIRQHIEGGSLPCVHVDKVYGTYGRGEPCDGCGAPIDEGVVLYEVRLEERSDLLRFHIWCYTTWQEECG